MLDLQWPAQLAALRQQWQRVDNAIALMPDSLLVEALDNPYLSELDKARILARLRGENGKGEAA